MTPPRSRPGSPESAEPHLPGISGRATRQKRSQAETYECACHGIQWPTLADFDQHRKETR